MCDSFGLFDGKSETCYTSRMQVISGLFLGLFIGPISAFDLLRGLIGLRGPCYASGNGAAAWGRFASDVFGALWLIVAILATLVALPFAGLGAFWIGPAIACGLLSLFMGFAALRGA